MLYWITLLLINFFIIMSTKREIYTYVNIYDEKDDKYYRVKLDNMNNFIEKEEVEIIRTP